MIHSFVLRKCSAALDRLCGRVPRGHVFMKIRVVGHVARNRGVVAEDLVFHNVLARLHGLEEISDMLGCVVVVPAERRMSPVIGKVAGGCGCAACQSSRYFCLASAVHPIQRVSLRLRARILRNDGERSLR